jgi:hypothetical protein
VWVIDVPAVALALRKTVELAISRMVEPKRNYTLRPTLVEHVNQVLALSDRHGLLTPVASQSANDSRRSPRKEKKE